VRSNCGQEEFPGTGCILEVIENQKLVWTSALLPDFRPLPPSQEAGLLFSAEILLESHPKGCRYQAIARHPDEASCKQHKDMGFVEGWGAALDQLIAHASKFVS
jgi:uncharacterized protein YndB with AHSA1/START domain